MYSSWITCAQQQLYFNLLIKLITIQAKINNNIDVNNVSYGYVPRVSYVYRISTKSNNIIPLRRQFILLLNILNTWKEKLVKKVETKKKTSSSMVI